jgi:hypothetical protein
LARFDMNGDEGASWAAASAPGVRQVAKIERQVDPGKLALYDVYATNLQMVLSDRVVRMYPLVLDVVRFYMPRERRETAVAMMDQCGQASVLLLSGLSFTPPKQIAIAEACYPA